MKSNRLFLLAFLLLVTRADAQTMGPPEAVPSKINFQGRVSVDNVNFEGNGQFKFALYSTEVSGYGPSQTITNTVVWTNDGSHMGDEVTPSVTGEPDHHLVLPVAGGLYSLMLGDSDVLNDNGFPMLAVSPLTLGGPLGVIPSKMQLRVWFNDGTNGFQLLTPDQKLTSVVYAFRAAEAATVPDGAIGTLKLANNAVTTAKLVNQSVTGSKISTGAVTSLGLADGAVTSNKLSLSAVTTSSLADGVVTNSKLDDGAVTASKIATAAVEATHIKAGTINTFNLSPQSVTQSKIADGSVATEKLADGAVTAAKIAANAVSGQELAVGAVNTAQLANGAVTSLKIASGAITEQELAVGAVNTTQVANGAITTSKIANGSVTSLKIASEAVTDQELASGAVTTSKIVNGAVTSLKIASGAVTEQQLAIGAVTTTKLADAAVTEQQLATSAVTTSKIALSAVTTNKIAIGAVTDLEIGANAVTSSKIAPGAVTVEKMAPMPLAQVGLNNVFPISYAQGENYFRVVRWSRIDANIDVVFDSYYDTQLYAPRKGFYLVTVNLGISDSHNVIHSLRIGKNGAGLHPSGGLVNTVAATEAPKSANTISLSCTLVMNSGDYVEAALYSYYDGPNPPAEILIIPGATRASMVLLSPLP
ncbi:MAG: hypothetical protein V4662_19520 [Verrucomicrobiota bacterium]